MRHDFRPPTRSTGLNDMRWCVCGHGHAAHTKGTGPCYGGTSARGMCPCEKFTQRPPEEGTPGGAPR